MFSLLVYGSCFNKGLLMTSVGMHKDNIYFYLDLCRFHIV